MKRIAALLFALGLASLSAQSLTTDQENLTPEQKYLRTRLNPQGTGAGISLEYAVTGSAGLEYGVRFADDASGSLTQGFETTIDSSLDITFTFRPDSFTASPRQSYLRRGLYAEIILTDFGVVISNDAGINFWDNYEIIDNEGNVYVPSQANDASTVPLVDPDTEDELSYDSTMLYTGVQVTAPSVEANIHIIPEVYFQIASQPELDHNLATTLGGQGEWAGAETENNGGFSFILDYPRFFMQASLVSQHYYDYSSSTDTTRQDDEFGSTLTASYEISDNLVLQGYGGYINFYTASNNDDFYFATGRTGSSADALALAGASLTYNLFELAEFGIYGDFAYVVNGQYNKGGVDTDGIDSTDDDYNYKTINGYLYDVRFDLPFPFAVDRGVVTLSADTYNYSYRDQIFTSGERNSEFPLDLQLGISYTEERWQIQGAVQAFNILDFTNSYENYLLDDHQEVAFLLSGQYTFGNPSRLAVTPGLDMIFSLGRLMTEGKYYSSLNDPGTYIDDWKDDYLSLEASVALEFPQTVMTLSYTSLQLLPGQGNSPEGSNYTGIDAGVLTVSTVVSY